MDDMTVTVTGNVTADPQNGQTQAGVPWTSFRVAHNRRLLDRNTQTWSDAEPSFLRVVCFRGLATNSLKSFAKGDRVIVHGRLRVRQWTGNDGHAMTTAEILADSLGHDLTWGSSVFTRTNRLSEAELASGAIDNWRGPGDETAGSSAPEESFPEESFAAEPFGEDEEVDVLTGEVRAAGDGAAAGTEASAAASEETEEVVWGGRTASELTAPVSTGSTVVPQPDAPAAERTEAAADPAPARTPVGAGRSRRR